MAYIIKDNVVDQYLSDLAPDGSHWQGSVNLEGWPKYASNVLALDSLTEAEEVVDDLTKEFKDQPGGANFSIIETIPMSVQRIIK